MSGILSTVTTDVSPSKGASANITLSLTGTAGMTAVTVNSVNLLNSAVTATSNRGTLIRNIVIEINNKTATTGYWANIRGGTPTGLIIFAPYSAGNVTYAVTFTKSGTGTVSLTPASPALSGYVA